MISTLPRLPRARRRPATSRQRPAAAGLQIAALARRRAVDRRRARLRAVAVEVVDAEPAALRGLEAAAIAREERAAVERVVRCTSGACRSAARCGRSARSRRPAAMLPSSHSSPAEIDAVAAAGRACSSSRSRRRRRCCRRRTSRRRRPCRHRSGLRVRPRRYTARSRARRSGHAVAETGELDAQESSCASTALSHAAPKVGGQPGAPWRVALGVGVFALGRVPRRAP